MKGIYLGKIMNLKHLSTKNCEKIVKHKRNGKMIRFSDFSNHFLKALHKEFKDTRNRNMFL